MFSSERLKGIDVFVCVSDSGSFKAAAERMNLTASAVSKGIARLESRLQVRLFNRTTRRLSLTDAGAAFYQTCTGVLAELEEAELSLQAENTEPRGRIRIDLPAAFGRLQALPVVLTFVQQHPQLQPHISFSDRFIDPVEEGVDIVVRVGGPDVWPAAWGHRYLGSEAWNGGLHIVRSKRSLLSRISSRIFCGLGCRRRLMALFKLLDCTIALAALTAVGSTSVPRNEAASGGEAVAKSDTRECQQNPTLWFYDDCVIGRSLVPRQLLRGVVTAAK